MRGRLSPEPCDPSPHQPRCARQLPPSGKPWDVGAAAGGSSIRPYDQPGNPSATARAARSGAERAGVEIRRFRFSPTSLHRTIGCGDAVLRRTAPGAGTTGPSIHGHTDSHDPRNHAQADPRCGSAWASQRFSFDRPRPFSFVKTKENGGGFPEKLPVPSRPVRKRQGRENARHKPQANRVPHPSGLRPVT